MELEWSSWLPFRVSMSWELCYLNKKQDKGNFKKSKLHFYIVLANDRARSRTFFFFPKELGTHFIIYNEFIIRLIFCKIEAFVTLTFKCFLFTCYESRSKGQLFVSLIFHNLVFKKTTFIKSLPTVQIQNISIFSAMITLHHPHCLKIPWFPSFGRTTRLLRRH